MKAALLFLFSAVSLAGFDLALGNGGATGPISVYSSRYEGKPTASGELYVPSGLTAAHATLPLGTFVRVANFETGQMVDVRVNDRKAADGQLLHLSKDAARRIGLSPTGSANGSLLVVRSAPSQPGVAHYPTTKPDEKKFKLFGGTKTPTSQAMPAHDYVNVGAPVPPVVAGSNGKSDGIFGFFSKKSSSVRTPAYASIDERSPAGGANTMIPMSAAGAATSQAGRVLTPIPSTTSTVPAAATSQLPVRPIAPNPNPQMAVGTTAPYMVQFGAFRRQSGATELNEMLNRAGIRSSVVQSSSTGMHLVLRKGGFNSASEAQRWIDFEAARRGWTERPVIIR